MSERKLVQCKKSFASVVEGHRVVVSAGDIYYDDDPVVKDRQRLFGELKVKQSRPTASTAGAVETTSAAPGTRRALSKPPAKQPAKAKQEEGGADA